MKFPVRQAGATGRLHVAPLDGGINRRDAAHLIDDRQLSDAQNVWWKDGALRMRPAFQTEATSLRLISEPLTVAADTCTVHTVATGCIASENGVYGEYVAAIRHLSGTPQGNAAEYEISLLLADGTRIDTDTILVVDGTARRPHRHVVIAHSGDPYEFSKVYAFIDGGRVFELTHTDNRYAWHARKGTVPTIAVAGRGYSSATGNPDQASCTVVRGFNRLSDGYCVSFTTDGESNCFVLPTRYPPKEVVHLQYTAEDGTYAAWNVNGLSGSFVFDGHTVDVTVDGRVVKLTESGQPFALAASSAADNLVIFARYSSAEQLPSDSITTAAVSTWFGGAGSGLTGGARLFVGGGESMPGMISWSAPNDPLDFPVNNYAVIGSIAEAVTAFAKQGDRLMIFKERSLYSAAYRAAAVDADDVIDGGITDLQAASAVFPITQLHPLIGCDCPHTVAMCDNRLVWATSQKRVYTLTAANAFSESNVLEISDLIRAKLVDVTADEMKTATALDCDGYYLLLAGTRAVALHYGKSSFGSLTATSAAKRAPFAWYAWEYADLNMRFVHAMTVGSDPILLAQCDGVDSTGKAVVRWATVTLGAGPDHRVEPDGSLSQVRIRGFVQTKPFDFQRAEARKRIVSVYPDTDTGGQWVWITDDGEFDEHTDGLCAIITPHLPPTARLSARVSFCGVFSLTGLTVTYQLWGNRKR